MSEPRISVVVPARNAAATLLEAVLPALGDPAVLEVVVVDDHSSDATPAIAAAAGARVLRLGPPAPAGEGPSAARNAGVAAARSDFLAFLDADDVWVVTQPDPRLEAFGSDPRLELVHGLVSCEVDGRAIGDPTVIGALHGFVVRRAAFERVGPFLDLAVGHDTEWLLRARKAGVRSTRTTTLAYRYRMAPGTLSAGEGVKAGALLEAVRTALGDRRGQPTVAVVIPVRDGERFLADAIASALAQDPAPAELIVVDDGSNDGSAALATSLGARVVTAGPPGGPNAARMVGVHHATADQVAFLDADDRWTPGRLRALREALDRDPTALGAYGEVEMFVEGDDPSLRSAAARAAGPLNAPVAGALLVRRRALLELGGLRTDLLTGEVAALRRAAVEAGRPLLPVDRVVLERRIHGENLTIRRAAEVHAAYLKLAREGAGST